ncbi:uncharacterized protein [Vicugna pacos]|uniref:Uncharacterized protein isoform X4 n=1 Tax=Vicugna pacos TaxID=30538 RepID=A0ABM5CBY8_VICPA
MKLRISEREPAWKPEKNIKAWEARYLENNSFRVGTGRIVTASHQQGHRENAKANCADGQKTAGRSEMRANSSVSAGSPMQLPPRVQEPHVLQLSARVLAADGSSAVGWNVSAGRLKIGYTWLLRSSALVVPLESRQLRQRKPEGHIEADVHRAVLSAGEDGRGQDSDRPGREGLCGPGGPQVVGGGSSQPRRAREAYTRPCPVAQHIHPPKIQSQAFHRKWRSIVSVSEENRRTEEQRATSTVTLPAHEADWSAALREPGNLRSKTDT